MNSSLFKQTAITLALIIGTVFLNTAQSPITELRKSSATGPNVELQESKGKVLRSRNEVKKTRLRLVTSSGPTNIPNPFVTSGASYAQGGVDGTWMYGSLNWSDNWDEEEGYTPYGIYRMPVNGSDGIRFVRINDKLMSNGGGVYKDGKYYFIRVYNSLWGLKFPYLSVADTENGWTLVVDEAEIPSGAMATDMTYDAVSDKAYGCFHTSDEPLNYYFGTFDLETGASEQIGGIADGENCYVGVASDTKGRVFAMGDNGGFYQINTTDGSATLIGRTGVTTDYISSACFDPATDKLYWNVSVDAPNGEVWSYLYEVDTTDGSLREVCRPALNEQFTGLFIFPPKAEAEAPDAVTALKVNVEPMALSGTLSFIMPVEKYAGETLEGEVGYRVKSDDRIIKEGKAVAGEAISVPFTVERPAQYKFEVLAYNNVGEGPVSVVEQWIGPDVPKAVENLSLVKGSGEGEFNLSWTIDNRGMHGEVLNTEAVSFNVVRYPGGCPVASGIKSTSISDKVEVPDKYTVYYYVVTPFYEGNPGQDATSNAASLGYIIPPYNEGFDHKFGFDVFTVLNVNGGNTWNHSAHNDNSCASVRFDVTSAMDDWLITPPMYLEANRTYHFSFKATGEGGMWVEQVSAAFGRTPTVQGMSTELVPVTRLEYISEYITLGGDVVPAESGIYYFGIHGVSTANQFNLNIDDVSVIPGSTMGSPAAPELSAVSDRQGEMIVTLSVKVPEKSIAGNALESIEKLELYRGNRLLETFTAPAPGSTLTYVDKKALFGPNTYTARAYNEEGEGATGSVEAYAGFDAPAAPQNVTIREIANGKVLLGWNAPTTGANGGALDPASVMYSIVRSNDEQVVASGIKECSFTDTPFTDLHQENVSYYVLAHNNVGYGLGSFSLKIPVGTAYSLPFAESFPGPSLTYSTWIIQRPENSNALWNISAAADFPAVAPSDRDGGMAVFYPSATGEEASLTSGKIAVAGTVNPVLEFDCYYMPSDDVLVVEAEADGSRKTTVMELNYNTVNHSEGWYTMAVPLTGLTSAEYIRLSFTARCGSELHSMCIDNIRLTDRPSHDLALTSLSIASRPLVGKPTPLTAVVENRGVNAAESYTIDIYCNGELQQSLPGFPIEPGASTSYIHAAIPAKTDPAHSLWEARINYGEDINPANDVMTVRSFAENATLPVISDLSAEYADNGSVNLTWSAAATTMPDYTVDDVESYEAFAIGNIGDWTMMDADGSDTYAYSQGDGYAYDYPNATYPMAYQVLNPSQIGLTPNELAMSQPYSGNQMFACWSAVNGPNDDWLISPVLSRRSQVVSFFARSLTTQYGAESFEMYYSLDGAERSDFVKLGEVNAMSVPAQWTEYAALLPDGCEHFAIRCISGDCFALLIDDLCFSTDATKNKTLKLKGYNIYRDGVRLNGELLPAAGYSDSGAGTSGHVYNVTAVYAEGESAGSNNAVVNMSGVADAVASTVEMYINGHVLSVVASSETDIAVYGADGRVVYDGNGKSVYRVELTTGLYLVKTCAGVRKIIVK
ncbi:MAG: choice-of-anchor J domain-containing protein [Muribaculaceae bacterium]|nr:choice-of-anchor J domain-containing protein [Muribaculaceae bacterium]